MVRCPFCGANVEILKDNVVCRCGEQLPEDLYKFERERCLCGKTLEFSRAS
ncbi:MAG: hypothetical protein NO474_03605 [Methanomassiliicoccales archaeon]|nr:hypothetical protein [Methanomassiliicoccales archaeon]